MRQHLPSHLQKTFPQLTVSISVHAAYRSLLAACRFLLAACSLPLAVLAQTYPQRVSVNPPAAPPPGYWQQQVDYSIDVALDTDEHTLDAFARIEYTNHSPDTLSFIWFHLWPNAYKNDQTTFSEQLLGNGRTDFYFSDQGKKGYINRLDFRADGSIAATEDHPQYIDVIKIILPRPLPPEGRTNISTPFHVQLPFDFSRGGYAGGSFQVAEWYPQPAVYDRYGWHPLPYLDQGGSYSEYGNFDVRITVPAAYCVAASGELISADSLVPDSPRPNESAFPHPIGSASSHRKSAEPLPAARPTRTLLYHQDNISDFAWFAAKNITVDHDTLALPSGRIIQLYACYRANLAPLWKDCIEDLKTAILFRSDTIGEYPFGTLTVVSVNTAIAKPAAYPGLIVIPLIRTPLASMIRRATDKQHPRSTSGILNPDVIDSFRRAIYHAAGQEWFSCIIGADQRRYPWMGEGIAAYYDRISPKAGASWASGDDYSPSGSMADPKHRLNDDLAAEKKDQPLSTSSGDFAAANYELIARYKTVLWLYQMGCSMGPSLMDSCLRQYYRIWQFRHPYPDDFRAVFETTSRRRLDSFFTQLDKKGFIPPFPAKRTTRLAFFYSLRPGEKYNFLKIGPIAGYNHYDQFMIGAFIHNFDLPPNRFQFLAAPLIGSHSNRLNGLGGLSYSWYPDNGSLSRILTGITGSRFSTISGTDSNGKKIFGGFYKIVPTARITFKKPSPRSTLERFIEWKTYLIGESGFNNYVLKTTDSNYYPVLGKYNFRYLNQLGFFLEDNRILYPYNALLQFQQGSSWYRVNFTGNYFFNYESGGGLGLRLFAAKFGHIGGANRAIDLTAFQPKLTGVTGNEDYTYSNYFLGRNEFTGLASQQIMIRDGGLKIRTDVFQGLQGRSDNWVAALNLNSSLPPGLLPPWIPLKVFLDIGTYAEAWHNDPPTSRFLYTAGLQLTPFRYLTIYAPFFYSSDFSNQLKTLPDQNTLVKKISFSIDFQTLSFGKKGLGKKDVDNPF
jgi:hypothetical protein